MKFEWDNLKAEENHRKHGVEFPYAAQVFLDPHHIVIRDNRQSYGEIRNVAMGVIEGRLYIVVFTLRAEIHRLISARKGNRREQKKYNQLRA